MENNKGKEKNQSFVSADPNKKVYGRAHTLQVSLPPSSSSLPPEYFSNPCDTADTERELSGERERESSDDTQDDTDNSSSSAESLARK